MTDHDTPSKPVKPSAKEKALADALRQNLMKRKQQIRARDSVPAAPDTLKPTDTQKDDI